MASKRALGQASQRRLPMLALAIGLLVTMSMYFVIFSSSRLDVASPSQREWAAGVESYNSDFMQYKRGIVMCLFDGMVPMAVSLVQELRALGNTDLVQMYHCNGELSPSSQRIITMMDSHVQIIDGCAEMVASGKLSAGQANDFRSFWLKPLALVHTHLEDVVLIDADDLVFQDVSQLWDVPQYKATGTIFFYDREIGKHEYLQGDYTVNDEVLSNVKALYHTFDYAQFGLNKAQPSAHLIQSLAWTGDSAHEQDSSIVVVNKPKAPKAMEILWRLVTEDRYRIGFSYGDKELFWLAYELAHLPYSFSPWANSGAARPGNMREHPDTLCGSFS
ncbi:hypothetical protein ACHHYP_06058 [Achlya hypogyna]|uniref:Uncharacterized protein n=1 Tax=Achlya hypogyna TaxID=1202772 RepID=A0A1V9YVU3_ACHHY|nr:hypothetical protein ACHHYP_06058 [Achlya hypogyna]